MIHYALATRVEPSSNEPLPFKEAITSKDSKKWIRVIDDGYQSLMKNGTWVLIPKPLNAKVVGCIWFFKLKDGIEMEKPTKYKSRLITKGFSQVEGVDYNETFFPYDEVYFIRLNLSIVVHFDIHLEKMNVKITFLHGELKEKVPMMQVEGYECKGKENYVCLLKRSLYSLKQSPTQCELDPCVYIKVEYVDLIIYLLLFVDDILIACVDMQEITSVKMLLTSEFEMK